MENTTVNTTRRMLAGACALALTAAACGSDDPETTDDETVTSDPVSDGAAAL